MLLCRGYLESEEVIYPNRLVKEIPENWTLKPQRGFGFSLLVFNQYDCPMGWTDICYVEGGKYESVRDWIEGSKLRDQKTETEFH